MKSSVYCNWVEIPVHAHKGSKTEHIHTFLLAGIVTGSLITSLRKFRMLMFEFQRYKVLQISVFILRGFGRYVSSGEGSFRSGGKIVGIRTQ